MSSDTDLKFITVLKKLGLPLDLKSFDSRLLLQKRMYLVQRLGLDLNLRYGWYIHGPYSTDLSHMAFRLQPIIDDSRINEILPTLSEEEEKQLLDAKSLFDTIDDLGDDKTYWYELAASIEFLQESKSPKLVDKEELVLELEEKKTGSFKKSDITKALDAIDAIRGQ